MKLISKLSEITDENLALTIGNFDGVHMGHQYVLKKIREQMEPDAKLVLISFNPHPIEVLYPQNNFLINEIAEKKKLLMERDVDYYLEIEFSRDLSTLTGLEFLNTHLQSNSHKIEFFLGYDFSFGANKADGVDIVEKFCEDNGYKYSVLERKSVQELSVSSSKIREYLNDGNIKEANNLLGRDFFVSGTIVKGEGRGRQIGFPTANMQYNPSRIMPNKGVYHTSVFYNGGMYKSITNIGVKPTFENNADMTVETFILDFDKDIYGESFDLFFHSKLREEKKFGSVNDLIKQITSDVEDRRSND